MLHLKPISYNNIDDFEGTSYDLMSFEQKQNLITASINKIHNGWYFEFLVVYDDDTIVGFMSLYAHSKHIISCSPTIKEGFQMKGYGFVAEKAALEYVRGKGYTIATGGVDDSNIASIALHEKLGFEMDRKYLNKKGRTFRVYVKAL